MNEVQYIIFNNLWPFSRKTGLEATVSTVMYTPLATILGVYSRQNTNKANLDHLAGMWLTFSI